MWGMQWPLLLLCWEAPFWASTLMRRWFNTWEAPSSWCLPPHRFMTLLSGRTDPHSEERGHGHTSAALAYACQTWLQVPSRCTACTKVVPDASLRAWIASCSHGLPGCLPNVPRPHVLEPAHSIACPWLPSLIPCRLPLHHGSTSFVLQLQQKNCPFFPLCLPPASGAQPLSAPCDALAPLAFCPSTASL